MKHVMFSGNGLQKQLAGGLVTIRSELKHPPHLHVQLSCMHVTATNNYGYFVNLNLSEAMTSEMYTDIVLINNTVPEPSSDGKKYGTVNSLVSSLTKTTHATFRNVKCSQSRFLRCIKIQSDESQVEIQNSTFVELQIPNKRGGAIFFNSRVNGSLILYNSTFHRNTAKGGGALFAHSQDGTLQLEITNCSFTECAAETFGCAILVGDQTNRAGCFNLIANFRNIRVHDSYGYQNRCDSVSLMLINGKVMIDDSSLRNNSRSTAGTLAVMNTGGNTDLIISGCTFSHNAVNAKEITVMAHKSEAGNVTIANCDMISQETGKSRAVYITSNFRTRLFDVVVRSYFYALYISGSDYYILNTSSDAYPFYLSIFNCTFQDNVRAINASSPDPTQVELTIENTIFITKESTSDSFGLHFFILPLKKIHNSKVMVEIDNVTFTSSPCNLLAFLFKGNKHIRIRKSQFTNCFCTNIWVWYNLRTDYSVYQFSTGAISVFSVYDSMSSPGCVKDKNHNDTHPTWSYLTHVEFADTLFEGNGGLDAGGVHLCNGHTTFKRCFFKNNFGIEQSGHVYLDYGTGKADFIDCIFNSTAKKVTSNVTTFRRSAFVLSDSNGLIRLRNTTLSSFNPESTLYPVFYISSGSYVYMDDNSAIQCPIGSKLLFDNATHFVYTEYNKSFCRINVTVLKYSCLRCSLEYYSIIRGTSRGLLLNNAVKCLPCPFGASCVERNIVAKPNFWGHLNRSSVPPSLTFFACPEHYCRKPGPNTNGYNSCSENRTGILCGECIPGYSATLFSTQCRKDEECDNYLFWKESNREDSTVHEVDHHRDNAYIKITFYFYQAAELLMVNSKENLLQKVPCIAAVIAAFNFKLRTLNEGLGCPFPGLTSVTKQLALSGTVLLTMADIALIYFFHCVINMIRCNKRPFIFHYMAVIMEVLLLGYERLAETCLKLITCVSIGSERRLFIDGNVTCMQWWQYLVLAYIAVFIVPFIVVVYLGSSKLHKASITAPEFLAACVLPLPFLFYWFLKKMKKRPGNISVGVQAGDKDVLEVLHGPFRPPKNDDKGTLYWESVLIGRRFILLACHSFITSPMLRMIAMATVCSLIALHHVSKNPFRERMANRAETISLSALLIISIINLSEATLISFGITITGPYGRFLDVMEWFEVGALAVVPISVSVLVMGAIVSQFVRALLFLFGQAGRLCCRYDSALFSRNEQRISLLSTAE
ncbi:hypothetical protein AWC38_SpisGene23448 [Stylophora pistillata]|uniref:Uncharacterized protein n=1 Tax=Stylophora pistillata TaxID=50429 RepID=A0A2B4R4M1_STYPI|nr:hypothetical protein AWC38_SpisGene23448 [Stylophora pistillata]